MEPSEFQRPYRQIIQNAEAGLGLKILTLEYEVVSFLFDTLQITPLEMQSQFSGSSASLFKILNGLEGRGVLRSEPNPVDGRSKLYCLSDMAVEAMHNQWNRYRKNGPVQGGVSKDKSGLMRNYSTSIYDSLKLKQFTCEFQILVYIYSNPGLANVRFHDLVDVSQAKFNETLARLKADGYIYFVKSPQDRRQKLYYLSKTIDRVVHEMTLGIFGWLASQPRFLTDR